MVFFYIYFIIFSFYLFYYVLIKFGVTMKLIRLIKMCVNETCSRVQVGKQLSDMFCIKNGLRQGGTLLPLLVNVAWNISLGGVQVNQDGLKLNGTHQWFILILLIYWAELCIL